MLYWWSWDDELVEVVGWLLVGGDGGASPRVTDGPHMQEVHYCNQEQIIIKNRSSQCVYVHTVGISREHLV